MIRRIVATAAAVCFLSASAAVSQTAAFSEGQYAPNLTEVLSFGRTEVPRWLAETIVRAAEATGVDPTYMMALADKESSFNYRIKASTSSAAGLYQFLEGTWLEALSTYGAKHGFGAAAAAITMTSGRATVRDPDERRWILGLRHDPYLSALMAGEMANKARERLARQSEQPLTNGDLYLAHFLGSGGANRLLELVEEQPNANAPKAFPNAAKANRSIFFVDKKKEATVAEVHARISAMMDGRMQRYAGLAVRSKPGEASEVPASRADLH